MSDRGDVISDAYVYVSPSIWTTTDELGQFQLKDVDLDKLTLTISRLGFREKKVELSLPLDTNTPFIIKLTERKYKDAPVVVTASRTKKELEDVSVPITVIDDKEIAISGSLRLADILDEQVGLNIVSEHGTGIQVQGFDPEYTLILIDNQPVIGRTAGTLDLTRLAVGDIKQIEMVKGPSSALWGSDALAGVINIITEKGSKPFSWDVTGRYGTHESMDFSSNITFKKNNLNGKFFTNVNGSGGYDLDSSTLAPTIPEYTNYTFSGGLEYRFNSNLTLGVNSRYYRENQSFADEIFSTPSTTELVDGSEFQEDISVSPKLTLSLGSIQLFEANAYISRFNSESLLDFAETGERYFSDTFAQSLDKYELKSSTFWNSEHTTVSGVGMNREDLSAEIYADIDHFDSYFVFGQHEWLLRDDLSITSGFRFDAHSEYDSQLSPKFSGLYKPNSFIHVRASLGGGFKAPAFRQLFLNFSNPIAGYSVFGSSTVVAGIEQLQADGQIDEVFFNPNNIEEIRAEHSFAYNAGLDLFPVDNIQFRINLFRNDVKDLIETQRIALKTNGQSVFSYFNLNKIYTQGAEVELRYEPYYFPQVRMTWGYQYLDAQQEITRTYDDVIDGEVVTITEDVFVPMFNRSKHSSNLKFFYNFDRTGVEASFRMQYRGKYGFADLNANQQIDEREYAEEHLLLNASVAKTFKERFRLQLGVNNITNYQSQEFLPSNPGRTFYTQLTVNLQ
jgi:outer membrane receptor for ferrienterochelin and colicins